MTLKQKKAQAGQLLVGYFLGMVPPTLKRKLLSTQDAQGHLLHSFVFKMLDEIETEFNDGQEDNLEHTFLNAAEEAIDDYEFNLRLLAQHKTQRKPTQQQKIRRELKLRRNFGPGNI